MSTYCTCCGRSFFKYYIAHHRNRAEQARFIFGKMMMRDKLKYRNLCSRIFLFFSWGPSINNVIISRWHSDPYLPHIITFWHLTYASSTFPHFWPHPTLKNDDVIYERPFLKIGDVIYRRPFKELFLLSCRSSKISNFIRDFKAYRLAKI